MIDIIDAHMIHLFITIHYFLCR